MIKKILFVILLIFIGIGIGISLAYITTKNNSLKQNNKEGIVDTKENETNEKEKNNTSNIEENKADKDINEKSDKLNENKEENVSIINDSKDDAYKELEEKSSKKQEKITKKEDNKEAEKKKDLSKNNKEVKKKVVPKKKTKGKWYFVNYNKEYYDIDEVGDDVSEIKINDVCEENEGVTTFCEREEDLRKSSAKNLGKEVCDGGGECKVGQSCLLWYDDTQDNGDVELKTATYKCE